jgi:peptidylprolyl isomerase
MAKAASGDRVLIHYRVSLNSGDIIDLSPDDEPLEVILGVGRYLPGIENAVAGMEPGEKRSVTVPAAEAFGPRLDDMVQEIGRELFPEDLVPEVGQTFHMGNPEKGGILLTVVAVDGDRIVVDANHPLAGEDLLVDVALIEILPPDPDALLRYIKDAADNDPTLEEEEEDFCGCGCGDECQDECDCEEDCDCEDRECKSSEDDSEDGGKN